jgi:hypothetical protein
MAIFDTTLLYGALKELPWDVFVDAVVRFLFSDPNPQTADVTPREALDEILHALRVYIDTHLGIAGEEANSLYKARVEDVCASLARWFHEPVFGDIIGCPRLGCDSGVFLGDCCGVWGGSTPTLRWVLEGGRRGDLMAATGLVSDRGGAHVLLVVDAIAIQGDSLKFSMKLDTMGRQKKVRMDISVASLAVAHRRAGMRGPTFGELIERKGICFPDQECRDVLEASRFGMSQIVSMSSTTAVRCWQGSDLVDRVEIEFPDIMGSIRSRAAVGCEHGNEFMLTVGACFIGLDLVPESAFYPIRLTALEKLLRGCLRAETCAKGFSSINRVTESNLYVLNEWEKRVIDA